MAFSVVREDTASHTILIQSSDKNIPVSALSQSAGIIAKRLNVLNAGKSEVKTIEGSREIKITLFGTWDLPAVIRLLEHKGRIEFYLAYNRDELAKLLKNDNHLFSLLKHTNPDNDGSKIGCVQGPDISMADNYLKTMPQVPGCKFLWSQDDGNKNECLYALKMYGEKGSVITSGNIDAASYVDGRIKIILKPDVVRSFADVTKQHLNSVLAIVLDEKVISAPRIMSEIDSGSIEITGDYTENEAAYIAAVINGGILPVNFKIVHQN